MPLDLEQLLEVAKILSNNANLRVTVKEAAKGGLLAGAGAFAGGLLGGPIGIAVGAGVGGLMGAYMSQGKFKSVPEVIAEMSPRQKDELACRLQEVLSDVNIYDVVGLTTFIMGNTSLRMQILGIITKYVQSELRMQIVD